MVVSPKAEITINIPKGVSVDISSDYEIIVSGPNGILRRTLLYPNIEIKSDNNIVTVSCVYPRKKEKSMVGTFASHIRNMIKGVTDGFQYKMKIVYSHFPMKVSVKAGNIVIENFLGERTPRFAKICGDTKVLVKGSEIILIGINKEDVGQTAANLERATRIRRKDPRVFQDGIYLVAKHG